MNFYKTKRWISKREKILRRDSYECRECKRYGKSSLATTVHHVHPLKERPELRLVSWNLLSLCGKCHDKMHDRITNCLTDLGKYWKEKINFSNPPT
jgi:5-methylcytosine-specific restriction enzyme A